MANPEHLEIVKQGAEAIRHWRKANPDARLDLAGANLRGANLSNADLTRADLTEADLFRANLTGASILGANLRGANLRLANLGRANLTAARLTAADLRLAELSEADLSESLLADIVFGGSDLSGVKGLESVRHIHSSTIDIDTLSQSKGKIPDTFLRGCGLQPWEILSAKLYDPTLTPAQIAEIQYRIFNERTKGYFLSGIFISYAHQDSKFVDQIYHRLTRAGANVWLDRHDLVAGSLQRQVFQGIRLNDVVLLVLSGSSLRSDWVENELDMARRKEKEQARDVLCPVALDDCWKAKVDNLQSDDRQLWQTLTKKLILDFSGWRCNGFEEPFRKLMDGIKRHYGPAPGG